MSTTNLTNITFAFFFPASSSATLRATLNQVIPIIGLKPVDSIADAQLVFTENTDHSLQALKDDKCVIQIHFGGKHKMEVASGLRSQFPERFVVIDDLPQFLSCVISALTQLESALATENDFDSSSIAVTDAIRGKRILLVDDNLRNRKVGQLQLGGQNELTVTASYLEALKLLDGDQPFDVVFTDLLMPTEGFTLGKKREEQIGIPIAAGHYVVNRALACMVPDIVVVSAGNHHDDPNLAALDYVRDVKTAGSKITYHRIPSLIRGGKDWAAAYKLHAGS
ncbi:MAG: hypothetical protein KDD69_14385 [Bdellovibrionales bacterium]|nr:hypothetical protein [Bdellovibrionales bacterium]